MDILCYVKKARERIANSMLPVLNEKKKRKEDNCITDRQIRQSLALPYPSKIKEL